MKISMKNGKRMAELYRETYKKNPQMETMGLRVFDDLTGKFVSVHGCTMPSADPDGCDFEFQRMIDKALRAGFYFNFDEKN